jgi:HPt (histidine-containing phosphotransfer) domain-containing protein
MISTQALDDLRSIAGDDADFLATLLKVFLDSIDTRVPDIEKAVKAGSPEKLVTSAHAFKSSCLSVGAVKMGECCLQLEALGKSGSTTGAAELLQALKDESLIVRAEIHALPEMK